MYRCSAMRWPLPWQRVAVTLVLVALSLCSSARMSQADGLPVAQSFASPFLEECSPWGTGTPLKAPNLNVPPPFVLVELLDSITPEERRLQTPIQFSFSHHVGGVWWDGLASYNDTAKPILDSAEVARQPAAAWTNQNKNTVLCFASLRLCEALLPAAAPNIRAMMTRLGLNPDDKSTDVTTAVGVGNFVAKARIQYALKDGMNRAGDVDHKFNRQSFSDYTAFIPQNDAYTLRNVTQWQPLLETNGFGYFYVQHHIAPQTSKAKAFSLSAAEVAAAQVASPYPPGPPSADTVQLMKKQTDQVIQASAGLTDRQKVTAEFYDDKLLSLAAIPIFYGVTRFWDIHTLLGAMNAVNCVYDATVVAWKEKVRHGAVRPISLVRHFYGDSTFKAYAGRDAGTQDISGSEWTSYLRTMPHAEYPSGTSCACAAWGEFMTQFLGSDKFTPALTFKYKKGCSRIEPGTTPSQDIQMEISSIRAMVRTCGLSRLHAGVHFMPSIDAGRKLCAPIGKKCFAKYQSLLKQ